ncbi:MAG: YidC/Oxa1 family insertase periplasmic-domain containing protein [Brevinematales bacterium]|jgi:YidC/Oxa1 family membrane protein insertase
MNNTGYERRMMIVFLLSLGLMIASLYFLPKNKNSAFDQSAATNSVATNVAAVSNTAPVAASPLVGWEKNVSPTNVTISYGDEINVKIDTLGGRVSQVLLNGTWNRRKTAISVVSPDNPYRIGDTVFGSLENASLITDRPAFTVRKITNDSVELSADFHAGKDFFRIIKTINTGSNYQIFEEVIVTNLGYGDASFNYKGSSISFPASVSFFDLATANNGNQLIDQYYDGSSLKSSLPGGFLFFSKSVLTNAITNALWISEKDNYFVSVMRPSFRSGYLAKAMLLMQTNTYKEDAFGIELAPFSLKAGESRSFKVSYYIGPKKEEILDRVDGEWLAKNEPGSKGTSGKSYFQFFLWWPVFNWFMKPIEWVMVKLMYVASIAVPNWGLIIILLALVIKLALSPLSIQAARSIKRSNLLQPKIKSLQEKYKSDQQTLNQKMAELYKKEGVNPLGGCLPMLLQIPVFFALLRVLQNSVDLKGASFLWMNDLTQPDTLFKMSIPFLPSTFNLLPLLMTGVQLIQMKLQAMKTVNAGTSQQNAMNSYLMPIIFLFIFWSMPSGLVLYWTIQSIYTIFEQEFINLDRHVSLK